MSDSLQQLLGWYRDHCDGDWEHEWRVRIGTLDNPGWSMNVNLADTFAKRVHLDRVRIERSDDDWYSCWTEQDVFQGYCGLLNLPELIDVFLAWVKQYEADAKGAER